MLFYKNNYPLAIVEAKDATKDVAHGIQQAIDYAQSGMIKQLSNLNLLISDDDFN